MFEWGGKYVCMCMQRQDLEGEVAHMPLDV
jgi:hypothetical protein